MEDWSKIGLGPIWKNKIWNSTKIGLVFGVRLNIFDHMHLPGGRETQTHAWEKSKMRYLKLWFSW